MKRLLSFLLIMMLLLCGCKAKGSEETDLTGEAAEKVTAKTEDPAGEHREENPEKEQEDKEDKNIEYYTPLAESWRL